MGRFKLALDIGKKLFPNASKKIQNYVKEEFNSARIHMSSRSAEEYAKASTRDKFKLDFSGKPKDIKSKNLGGGISSGPPPKRGPNPQGLSHGGCPHRQPSKKNIYPGNNGIQIKGHKFSGVR